MIRSFLRRLWWWHKWQLDTRQHAGYLRYGLEYSLWKAWTTALSIGWKARPK